MTRACLRWAVLMATLGSALLLAGEHTSPNLYRLLPFRSQLQQRLSLCGRMHGGVWRRANLTVVETVAANDSQENLDLSGRTVVAIIEDPMEAPADECQYDAQECAEESTPAAVAADTQVASEVTTSECPHYSYWEDYYGYDNDRSDCPCYEEPADDLAGQDPAASR